jgi:hypothetical protein
VLAAACSKDNEPAADANSVRNEPVTPTPASATRSAVEAIVQSRCTREQTCKNIGDGEKYSTASDCYARIRNDWKDDLNARECPGGIDESQLDQCLAKIRAEDCGNPFDTLSRVTECTVAQICEG